jgi:two-component system phosphate regulon sensor histidine kinase PhoR
MEERFLPSTVRGRLTLTFGALSLLIILGLGAYLILSVRDRYEGRLAHQLEEQARMAASAASAYLTDADPRAVDREIDALGASIPTRLTILDASGNVLADSQADPAAVPAESDRSDTRRAIDASIDGDDVAVRSRRGGFLVVTVPIPGVSGDVARASTSLEEVDDAVERFQRNVLATGLVVAWISFVVSVYVAGRITGPLEELRQHAALVAAGQLDSTVTPASTRELGDLARAFNTMTRRVGVLVGESELSRSRLEAIFANLSDGRAGRCGAHHHRHERLRRVDSR